MGHRRPRGVLALGWACIESAAAGRTEHVPTAQDYPETVLRRTAFRAGGGLGWRISALETPRPQPAPLKIVVVPGAPCWAEYWAPVMAALPLDREMLVVDRPGFAGSEPETCVPDIRLQATALAPLLNAAPGQKILLIGQSYGAAIATVMAARNPRPLAGVVLLSSYLGEPGPTARFLLTLGERALSLVPRDLRNALVEVGGQQAQLIHMRQALKRLRTPVHVIHGDADDFAPIGAAERLVKEMRTRPRAWGKSFHQRRPGRASAAGPRALHSLTCGERPARAPGPREDLLALAAAARSGGSGRASARRRLSAP